MNTPHFNGGLNMWRQPSWLTESRGFQPGGNGRVGRMTLQNWDDLDSRTVFPGGRMPALYGRPEARRYNFRHALNAGFSLIEVMVAILILGIALAGLTHGISTALGSSKDSEYQATAVLFAQGKIEELRATPGIKDGSDEGSCGAALDLYRWKQTITATDLDGLHDVEVVVENSHTGQAICDLRTLLFEVPPSSDAAKGKDAKSKKKGSGGR